MRNDLDKIRNGFAFMNYSHSRPIPQENGYSYRIFRWPERIGVGIEIPKEMTFSEQFATARLTVEEVFISDESRIENYLLLTSTDLSSRNEFAMVCANFIELGQENLQRKNLVINPAIWWKRWKSLIGNTVSNRPSFALLGELIIYQRMLEANQHDVVWNGPKRSSHDIELVKADYEIKSTLQRYESLVNVSGQHQLAVIGNKSLYVILCRFEPTDTEGISINSVVQELIDLGVDRIELEKKLSALGYEEGRTSRLDQFILHGQPQVYAVNNSFPKITEDSFVDGVLPKGILRITYQVDLTGLTYTPLDTHLQILQDREQVK